MASSAFNTGVRVGQSNPSAKVATPQQIPSATVRNDYNNGLKYGQRK